MKMPVRLTLLLAVLVAAPAAAQEATGGAAAPEGPDRSRVVVVSDGAFTVAAREDALLGRVSAFRGTVDDRNNGRTLTVERYDAADGAWKAAARTTVEADGRFVARWRTDRVGRFRLRAVVASSSARAASASPELAVTVYRPGRSTWYGPGFYGRRTACGQKLTRDLQGVAHKRLPCGTRVAILYRGRRVTVPVVDRGPYRKRTRWDLTAATARSLGFDGVDRIGALRVAASPAQPSR